VDTTIDPIPRATAGGRWVGGTPADAPEGPELERFRINLSWLRKLRWAAAVGQVVVILAVHFILGIDLPLGSLLGVVGVLVASNVALDVVFRPENRAASRRIPPGRGEWILGSIMLLDIVLLSVLLCLTGGPSNPFSIFYLVNIALASAILREAWAWSLNGIAILGFGILFFFHHDLLGLGGTHGVASFAEGDARTANLYRIAMLVAVGVASTTVVYFVGRVKGELARREAELGRERQRQTQSERLQALATLAAGAAHELATPLSTIAVVSKDLERQLGGGAATEEAIEDVRLVRQEVQRCRTILDQMAYDAGESVGEGLTRIGVPDLCGRVLDGLQARRVDVVVEPAAQSVILHVPIEALTRAVRGIVKNALDASDTGKKVSVEAAVVGPDLRIRVLDRGSGMAPEVLDRAADPFFTTKEPGRGMGLGLYLARSVLDRLGGSLRLESRHGEGTIATILVPIETRPRV